MSSSRVPKTKKALKPTIIRKYVLLVVGWAIVVYMCYLIATTKVENQIWDPYAILGISTSLPLDKIKIQIAL
jgi:translocation protein SEC63